MSRVQPDPRSPTDRELALLRRLLEPSFPGVAELRKQLDGISVAQAAEEDVLTLLLMPADSAPRAVVRRRVPVEGIAEDVDGVPINLLLHVLGGRLTELEIFRGDGGPVVIPPAPGSVEVLY